MKLKDNFLAIKFHQNKDFQKYFIDGLMTDEWREVIYKSGYNEMDWHYRGEAMREMASSKEQKLYYISTKVQEHAKFVKFDKIELSWFKNIGTKHATYILNKNEFYRFWINGDKSIHISYFKSSEPIITLGEAFLVPPGLESLSDIPICKWDAFVIRYDEFKDGFMPMIPGIEKNVQENFVKLLLFIEMATISYKMILPNQKIKIQDLIGGRTENKIINESGVNVVYVDTSWNKTLYVNGIFAVNGHIRIQPYFSKLNPKFKMIWIDEYEKQGYLRRASKLKEEGHSEVI